MSYKDEVIVIRLKRKFVEECLDPIIESEKRRGREKTTYPEASELLRKRIEARGGIREK